MPADETYFTATLPVRGAVGEEEEHHRQEMAERSGDILKATFYKVLESTYMVRADKHFTHGR